MVDLLGLLPLLNGWDWINVRGSKQVASGDDAREIFASEESMFGWLISARMSTDVSDAELQIIYDPTESRRTLKFDLNPSRLYSAGYYYRSHGPYVANYNETNNEYAAEFFPQPPIAMKGSLEIYIIPGSSDGTVHYDVTILEVSDIDAFVDSLRDVFGVPTIIDALNNLRAGQPQQPIELPEVTIRQYRGFLP